MSHRYLYCLHEDLGSIGTWNDSSCNNCTCGFPSRKWDVHGIYYRKIKLQVAEQSYMSGKWKLFVRFVDKMETFPPKCMHLPLQTNIFLVHPQNGMKKFGTPWWCSAFLFYKKLVGGFGCVIFGHKSFTMAFSIIFPFPMVSTPHQWRPPKVSVTAIGLVCTASQEATFTR